MTATHTVPRTAGRPVTVALVGPDGAGKSTVSRALQAAGLPRPVKVIYMGVNLEASSLMLPTTRLLLAVKRRRGRRPDLVAGTPSGGGPRQALRESARLTVWILEEWLRQAVARAYSLRGHIVVFDRHFLADYYHADVRPDGGSSRPARLRRLHGWLLEHGPKPDLMIMLDVPADRMHGRKPESEVAWLEQRRKQYLELAGVVPRFVVLDADRPLEVVVSEAADLIRATAEAAS